MRLVLHPKVYSDIDEIMRYYERVATPGKGRKHHEVPVHTERNIHLKKTDSFRMPDERNSINAYHLLISIKPLEGYVGPLCRLKPQHP